jgi:hypothetical protein
MGLSIALSGSSSSSRFGDRNIALLRGDFNRDGHQSAADIQVMMVALADLSRYQSYWDLTAVQLKMLGELDRDGKVTNDDLQGLIISLADDAATGPFTAVPEPSTWIGCASGWLGIWVLTRLQLVGASLVLRCQKASWRVERTHCVPTRVVTL